MLAGDQDSSINLGRRGKVAVDESSDVDKEELTAVSTEEELAKVPEEFLSGDAKRPLLLVDEQGNEFKFALKPMYYSVILILIVEMLERLAYYGVGFTLQAFLTGEYGSWSPNMSPTQATTYVQSSVGITYSMPFVGALVADSLLGNYFTILLFSLGAYLPGLVILALTAYPYLLGETFNTGALTAAVLVLWPVGAGAIKSCVNVFGAQQFHPVLQRGLIERYYVNFYVAINIGALVGGMSIPIVCQHNLFVAYIIPACLFALAIGIFLLGTKRYVYFKPQGKNNVLALQAIGSSLTHCPPSMDKSKDVNGGKYPALLVDSIVQLASVIPITMLVLPFNIAYAQMISVFIVQGSVMSNAGFVDASWMQNFDALSVLTVGFFTSTFLYPFLEKHNKSLSLAHKFALGTLLGALALAYSIIIDYKIHAEYASTAGTISVMWQAPAFFLIGAGEIFCISAAYEAAFLVAPKNLKALSSAINIFLIGGLPSFICTALVAACAGFFPAAAPQGVVWTPQQKLAAYAQSQVYNYFWVLFAIAVAGFLINLLPPVNRFLNRKLESAKDANSRHSSTASPKAEQDNQPNQLV